GFAQTAARSTCSPPAGACRIAHVSLCRGGLKPVYAQAYDPLADLRTPDAPEFDVFLAGTVFLDIVFTGLPHMPAAGTEVWAEGMGSCPGGIANLAIATSRLAPGPLPTAGVHGGPP